MNGDQLLEVRGLRKRFSSGRVARGRGGFVAVDGVDLELREGETLGLVGESGSGKTTTGLCVLRLMEPSGGSIRFAGTELTTLGRSAMRRLRRHLQIVFQDPYASLDPRMTVGATVAEPLVVHGIGTRRGRRREVEALLEQVGVDARHADRYPHEFSGGQRQRIGIARALALRPRLVVCDEPVSALDVSIQAQILNLLKDLQRDLRLAYLFIAHDLAVVRTMSDRIAVMHRGRIVEQGAADQVYEHPVDDYTRQLLSAVPVADPTHRARRARPAVHAGAGRDVA